MVARQCLLVVDDEPEVVHSLQDLLRFDYRVLGTTRATEGLKILEREKVHIVMSDQRMPEMTGVEFLQQLRSHASRYRPPAVHRLRRHQGRHRRHQPGPRLSLHHQALGRR